MLGLKRKVCLKVHSTHVFPFKLKVAFAMVAKKVELFLNLIFSSLEVGTEHKVCDFLIAANSLSRRKQKNTKPTLCASNKTDRKYKYLMLTL